MDPGLSHLICTLFGAGVVLTIQAIIRKVRGG